MIHITNDITRQQAPFKVSARVKIDPDVQRQLPYLTSCFVGTDLRVMSSNKDFTTVVTDSGVAIKEYTNWFIEDTTK